jgi:hypothetical protein
MFSCCRDSELLSGILEGAFVVSAAVDKQRLAMKVSLLLQKPAAPVDITMIEDGIKAEFGLSSVIVTPIYPRSAGSERKWLA